MVQVRSFRNLISLSLFVVLALFLSGQASAQTGNGWSVCNETSRIVELSTGRSAGNDVIIEGWNRVRPGECRVVLPAPLTPGPYFLYGRSSRAHRGGVKVWSGDYEFCVDSQGSFSVESPPDCTAMGLEARQFQPILIESRTSWTTTLKETQLWTGDRAQAAGIQRLLDDAGIESGTIDGYIGRRTRAAIRTFLTERELSPDTPDTDLIDYLEQVAIERSRNIGLTLCNRSENRVWTAIGRRRGEGWESRGWWGLEAGSCERVVDQALIAASHFVYAEMETPGGQKALTGGFDVFCISRSQFAILGKEDCGLSFYEEVSFVETEVPEDGRLVFEFFERDFEFIETGEES